jgi:predicted dithiol-disulfide oxidoreductase (DUF899 family)
MDHEIVTREDWLAARKALLAKEKALTRAHDALAAERRALPWVRVDKPYAFEGAQGTQTLADLFDGRSQLFVQHFMMGPGWEEGCVGCSFTADHVDGARVHLEHHDVSFVAISRAPWPEIAAYRARMGWGFRWVSSFASDFNYDFHVAFTPDAVASGKAIYNYAETDVGTEDLAGISVFYRDEGGAIFHTYSAFGRGDESLIGAYAFLDMTPKGRNETGPGFNLGDWVRHHDRYEAPAHACCHKAAG